VGDIKATIDGDELPVKQMLQKLIENAIKITAQTRAVEVELMFGKRT